MAWISQLLKGAKVAGKALKAKKTKDLSKLDLARKELKIVKIKEKSVTKWLKM